MVDPIVYYVWWIVHCKLNKQQDVFIDWDMGVQTVKRETLKEWLWEIKRHNSYCNLWTPDFLMAWLSAPSGLKRSAIDRGIDFGHHIQDSSLLSFTTAEATFNIQPSISLCWITCSQMAMRYLGKYISNWSWPILLLALTIEDRIWQNPGQVQQLICCSTAIIDVWQINAIIASWNVWSS